MQTIKNLEDINEEFNNFMHKVNEISGIVKKLSSDDKQLQQIGTLEADQYLKEKPINEDIDDENIKLRIKNDKSVINWNALKRNEDPSTMSQGKYEKFICRSQKQPKRINNCANSMIKCIKIYQAYLKPLNNRLLRYHLYPMF